MAKGIIVVEMPEKCSECSLKSQLYDNQYICTANHRRFSMFAQNKPDWCPLRELPEKKHYEVNTPVTKSHSEDYREGWNACIDMITGENG